VEKHLSVKDFGEVLSLMDIEWAVASIVGLHNYFAPILYGILG